MKKMEFEDVNDAIWHAFRLEYMPTIEKFKDWNDFIKAKNLGIEIVNWQDYLDQRFCTFKYRVLDKKKWFACKIKYGI